MQRREVVVEERIQRLRCARGQVAVHGGPVEIGFRTMPAGPMQSVQALLDAIWDERRAELAMEQHRYFDLIRQGRAAEELENFQPRHVLYPIPQSELDLTEMTQNEGYQQ